MKGHPTLNWRRLFLLAGCLLWTAALPAATVRVAPGPDGQDRVILENDQLRVEVNPALGGRVDGFRFQPWGEMDLLPDRGFHGLFVDHFWQESWPGQFWKARYDYQVISPGPEQVAVKFSRLSRDEGVPQVAGILLEKTLSLRQGERTLEVTLRLTNTTDEGKYVGYWLQNVAWMGGDKDHVHFFRPSKRGVLEVTPAGNAPDAGFVREPQAGWTAGLDERTRTGLVWFMDFNSLWFLYNCGTCTIEWQDDAVALPPGKSWQTRMAMAPFSGLSSVSYASERLLLGTSFQENQNAGRLEVTQRYVATSSPLQHLQVQTSLETLLTHQRAEASPAAALAALGPEPQIVVASLPWDTAKREPTVIRLSLQGQTAAGQEFSERAELFYPGCWLSDTVPMDGSPLYQFPSPSKARALIKPDRIARLQHDPPRVLFLKGLLSPQYRLEPALRRVSPHVQVREGFHYNGGTFGWQLDYFPYDYEVLMGFDLVILGDLNAAALNDTALEMLQDYCLHGGNLLVLGGPYAYGVGGYRGTRLDALLPVSVQGPFDLRPAGAAAVASALPAEVLPAGAASALRPSYLHQVLAKPDAQVLLSSGPWPLLVAGRCGEGRVYCLTAPPLGDSHFCDTREWREVLTYLFREMGLNR